MTIMIIEAIGRALSLSISLSRCANACVCALISQMQKPFGPCTLLARMRLLKYGALKWFRTLVHQIRQFNANEISMTLNLRLRITHGSFTASLRCRHRNFWTIRKEINYKVATVSFSIASISCDAETLHGIQYTGAQVFFTWSLFLLILGKLFGWYDVSGKQNKIRFIFIESTFFHYL